MWGPMGGRGLQVNVSVTRWTEEMWYLHLNMTCFTALLDTGCFEYVILYFYISIQDAFRFKDLDRGGVGGRHAHIYDGRGDKKIWSKFTTPKQQTHFQTATVTPSS